MNPVAGAVLLACVALMQVYGIHVERIAGGYGGGQGVIVYGAVVAAFLPTLIGSGPINRILHSRPFVFVGQRSYSLYLIQILAGQALVGMNPYIQDSARKAILTALVGLVFSDVLYRWVELPMIAAGKRLSMKLRERSGSRKDVGAIGADGPVS